MCQIYILLKYNDIFQTHISLGILNSDFFDFFCKFNFDPHVFEYNILEL